MKINDIFKFIVVVIMFFGGGIIISLILINLGVDLSNLDLKDKSYLDCLITGIYGLVIYILYRKTLKEDLNKCKEEKKFGSILFKYFVLFIVIKIASSIATGFIGSMLGMEIGESENQEEVVKLLFSGPLMMMISSSFFAPLVEEGVFRLGLKKVISNKKLFIIISGLLFGLIHIFPTDLSISVALTYSISYISTGLYFAYIYADTDNIWYPIIIHGLNNFISILLIFLIG